MQKRQWKMQKRQWMTQRSDKFAPTDELTVSVPLQEEAGTEILIFFPPTRQETRELGEIEG